MVLAGQGNVQQWRRQLGLEVAPIICALRRWVGIVLAKALEA